MAIADWRRINVKLPNVDRAMISRTKIVQYLLSPSHPGGRGKARWFVQYGFSAESWERLADVLKRHAVEHEVTKTEDSPFGRRYSIEGRILTPDGQEPLLRTVRFVGKRRGYASVRNRLPDTEYGTMMQELDLVVLTVDLPSHGLKAGDVGTLMLTHGSKGYEVEFTTLDGASVAVVSLTPARVRPILRGEIAHVRPLQAA